MVKNDIIIYTDNLNKKFGIGKNKNKLVIDWKNSVGYKIKFFYNDIEGYIKSFLKSLELDDILSKKYNSPEFEKAVKHGDGIYWALPSDVVFHALVLWEFHLLLFVICSIDILINYFFYKKYSNDEGKQQ